MTWDLAKALHKMAKVETARLQDFAFRTRARAVGLIATQHGLAATTLAAELAVQSDQQLIAKLCQLTGNSRDETVKAWQTAIATAREQLVAELDDPRPHRLA